MQDIFSAIGYLEQFSYIGIFILLLFSGSIFPIPEEIILLAAGYLSSSGLIKLSPVLFVSFFAILLGDILLFKLSSQESKYTEKLKEKIKNNKFFNHKIMSHRHIGRTIFVMRFIPGLRFLSPIVASIIKMKPNKFLFYDSVALLVYTPIFVFLGFYSHNSFLRFITEVEAVRHVIFFLILALVGISAALLLRNKLDGKNNN